MATLIGSHSGWIVSPVNTNPSFTADPGAAQDVALVLVVCYITPESPDANNWQATWGGESSTARSYDQAIGAVTHNTVVFQWDSLAAADRQSNGVSTTSVANDYQMSYAWFLVENAKAGAPLQELVINGQDSLVAPSQAVTLNGAADYQVGLWNHHGTFNRTFTPDADFTTVQNEEVAGGGNWEYGVSDKAAGGETDYTVASGSDAFPFVVIGMTFDSPSTGFSFISVDGGTTVTADKVLGDADNRAVAYVENGSDVTSVELNGVTQADFLYTAFPETIKFSATLDSTADTKYGTYTNGLVFKDADGAGVDVSTDITVAPPVGYDYVTVSGYTEGATPGSILDLFNQAAYCTSYGVNQAAVANGDLLEWQIATTAGNTVTMGADGVPVIENGTIDEQLFQMQVHRVSDSNQYSGYAPVLVNFPAVITEVDGVTGAAGKFNTNATNIVFKGSNFGVELGGAELWAMPGENVDLDTTVGVQQNPLGTEITSFSNSQFTLSSFNDGGGTITGGTYITFWFIPGASP